jgi:hypothetical protein
MQPHTLQIDIKIFNLINPNSFHHDLVLVPFSIVSILVFIIVSILILVPFAFSYPFSIGSMIVSILVRYKYNNKG